MPLCYVLPGILGSELFTQGPTTELLWVQSDRLAFGEFDRLELDHNGAFPKPPRGKFCIAGKPLNEFYGDLIDALRQGLNSHGYSVIPWGYDWRMDISGVGEKLAKQIKRDVPANDPCTIVAHSQGGLVARLAWYILKGNGEEGLIRRIITLGTPHRGSYAPALVWSGQEEMLSTLGFIMAGVVGIQTAMGVVPPQHLWTTVEIAAITGTWPAMYQMLPLLDATAQVEDPQRAGIFVVGNWPSKLHLSSEHFLATKNVFQDLLRSGDSLPPPHVLTTVAGEGFSTPFKLASAAQLGDPEAFQFSSYGDGRVMVDSALVLSAKNLQAITSHAGIIKDPWILERLPAEVLEVRIPPVPPAPPIVSPVVSPCYGTGPPLRLTPDFGHDC